MKEIENNSLRDIKGGAVSPWMVAGIGALVTFISGIIDGIARPFRCN